MMDGGTAYYGKFRGVVSSVTDPDTLGRIQVTLEAFPGFKDSWCMPCVPYAGDSVGWFVIPEVGSHVWIEFEGGDPSRPIWTGCFWTTGKIPTDASPTRKTFRTKTCTLVLDDLDGSAGQLEINATVRSGVTVSMTMTKDGITLTSDKATITMAIDTGVTVAFPQSSVALTSSSTKVAVGSSNVTVTADSTAVTSPSISLTAANELTTSAGSSTSMTSGQFSVSGTTITLSGAAINIG